MKSYLTPALLSLLIATPAFADVEYYQISGTLSRSTTTSPFNVDVDAGTPFVATLRYDPSALTCGTNAGLPGRTVCQGDPGLQWAVHFGIFNLTVTGGAIINAPGSMQFSMGHFDFSPNPYLGFPAQIQPSSTAFGISTTLPYVQGAAPDLASATGATASFGTEVFFPDSSQKLGGTWWHVGGSGDDFKRVSVPEPDLAILAIPAALGLWFSRRKKVTAA